MLSKDFKIDKKLIPLVLKEGKIFNSPYFTLRVFKQKTDCKKFSLFSFVVSKKVAKNATNRNKLKRKGFYIIRKIIQKTRPCFVCVFSFKKEILNLSFLNLEKEILQILKKIHIFNE